jgi:DNA mismatch repair protein MutS
MAGLPRGVVHRAHEVLIDLEAKSTNKPRPGSKGRRPAPTTLQISLFGEKSPVLEELENLQVDSLTPLEALNKLFELQKKARGQ